MKGEIEKVVRQGMTHHSVPTIKMPGRASLRNVMQLRASRTARSWKPPHVPFCAWVGEYAVYMMRKKNAKEKVNERAMGEP
jgi:hypothetical protein